VALALTLFGVLPLLVDVSQEMLWGIAALFLLAECVLPALWANALYYQHCNRVLTLALQASPDISATQARLTALSSSRARAWVVSALTLALWLSVATLGAWLAWGGPAGLGLRPLAFAPARSASTPRPASGASAALAAAASGVQMPAASAAPALPASTAVSEAAALTAAAPPASAPTGAEVSVSTVPTASASLASAPVPATVAKPAAVAVPSAQRQPPARPKAAASASSASNKTGKFVVAVGQFAQEQNANKAYEKLEAAGLPVHSNNVDGPDGTLLLIRVGPFAHLAEARQAAQQIRALGLPAVVMRR
jgi:DedD protein